MTMMKIPQRLVALATAGFPRIKFRKTRAGLKLERSLGPGLRAPPRRAHLLSNSAGGEKDEGTGLTVSLSSTDSGIEQTSETAPVDIIFPSTEVDQVSEPPETHTFTGSSENGGDKRSDSVQDSLRDSPAKSWRSAGSHIFSLFCSASLRVSTLVLAGSLSFAIK